MFATHVIQISNKMLTVENLIGKGYFPQELIPALTTQSLVKTIPLILPIIDSLCTQKSTPVSQCEEFTIPKIKSARRTISVPNPLHQIKLSQTISINWNNIEQHVNKSNISATRLELSDNTYGTRTFKKIDFQDSRIKLSLLTTARYVLKFDIARFYSSIYTHSIPWALHTKAISKEKRKRTDLYGNAIDADIRATQDGQTNGIPVGPDTSRIASEIIASAIDAILETEISNIKGTRYVDDYLLYFRTYSEVENAISIIRKALSEFHLEFNQAKFYITELPEPLTSQWVGTLSKFTFRTTNKEQEFDLFQYFSLAFEFSKTDPEAFVLPYAVSRFQTIIVSPQVWPILEDFLFHILHIEPKTIRYVCNIIIAYSKKDFTINTNKLGECLNNFISINCLSQHSHEVSWACWLANELKVKIQAIPAKQLSEMPASIVALTCMNLNKSGLIEGGLDVTLWDSLVKEENLYTENWLLVYESVKQGWINRQSTFFDKDPFFKILSENDVKFFDPAKPLAAKKISITKPGEY